jgi:hypothetical protein
MAAAEGWPSARKAATRLASIAPNPPGRGVRKAICPAVTTARTSIGLREKPRKKAANQVSSEMKAQLSKERDTPIAMTFGLLRQNSPTSISVSAMTFKRFLYLGRQASLPGIRLSTVKSGRQPLRAARR